MTRRNGGELLRTSWHVALLAKKSRFQPRRVSIVPNPKLSRLRRIDQLPFPSMRDFGCFMGGNWQAFKNRTLNFCFAEKISFAHFL